MAKMFLGNESTNDQLVANLPQILISSLRATSHIKSRKKWQMPTEEFEGVLHRLNNEINLRKKTHHEKPALARGPPGEWREGIPVVEVNQKLLGGIKNPVRQQQVPGSHCRAFIP
jgi:hypothetical protein